MTLDKRDDAPAPAPRKTPAASRPLRPRVLPWVVLACTLLSTFAVAYYVWSKDQLRADSAAREAAQAARDRIETRLNNYALLLRGVAGLMSNQLSQGARQIPSRRGEFSTYVQRLELPQNYASVRGLGFNLRLSSDEREGFERNMRDAGVEGFAVWSNDPNHASAKEVFPVVLNEPASERNRAALGFDPFSEPVRRAAMTRARDDAAPIATGVVTLVNRTDQTSYPGIVLFLPVYHTGGAPTTLADRRLELAGFVFAGIRCGELLDDAFPTTNGGGTPIDLSIYDGDTLIDRTDEPASPNDAGAAAASARLDTAPKDVDRTINAAGRTWTIAFRPHPRREFSFRPVVVPAIVAIGSGLAFMLFLLTNSEGAARMRAERAARELQASEDALVKTNASLRESESRLRTLTDANIVGMLIADSSGRIHEANDAFLRLVGRSRGQLTAGELDWKRLTAPQFLPRVEAAIEEMGRTRRSEPYETELLHHDGSRVPVLIGKASLDGGDGGGAEIRFVGFVVDLTERKRAEESLRKSEDQLRLITDSLPVLVSYIDADERYRFANRQYEQWFGVPGAAMIGRPLREVIGDASYSQRRPYIAAALTGQVVRFHGPTPHQDGSTRETELTYVPDRTPDGTVRGFVSLAADVTEQRRTEQTLRRYADLFQHAELGLVVTGPDGVTLEMANPAFARTCGYAAEELAGRSVLEVFAPEYRTEVPSHIRIARERGHHTFESTFQHKNGARFPVEIDVTAVKSPGNAGDVVYHILNVTDITEHERTEAELRYQLHLTNTITANAADSLFLMDAHGRVTFMNPTAESRFGWSQDDVVGKPLQEVLRPGRGALEGVFQSGKTLRDHEDVFFCKDGSSVNVLCTNAPILTGDLVSGAVLVVHDITERKRAERDREQLLQAEQAARARAESLAREAENANRSKDEFLATLSHELRTPLNAMLGWAQLLRMGNLSSEESSQGLDSIERNARAQAQLVEDLLDLSRIISGKLRLDVAPVDLPAVIASALDSVRPAAEAKGIRLIPVLDSHAGKIRGDANRLQQVVWNLLSNAIKFTPKGGEVQIVLTTSGDGQAEVSVSDTGEGISPKFLPQVFDRLRQADASITRKHGGLGLGLSIVRHLVELHGGTVSAHSEGEGRGATFTVRLPLSAPEQPADLTDVPRHRSESSGTSHEMRVMPSLAGTHVLVVDDEPDARDLIGRILRQCGAQVSTAASAREAAEMLPATRPDVLLSDIGMPDEDGYSLMRRVRAMPDEQGGQTPAIALTAFARNDDRVRALAEGFQLHVAKPVEAAELAEAVASLVGAVGRTN